MTQARMLTAPGEGHGLTDRITNELYQALVDGKPTRPLVAVVLLDPVATSQRKTARGLHRQVAFEAIRLEPVLDSNQAGELMWLIQALYEQRTSTGKEQALPLGIPGLAAEEKRQAVMEQLEGWAGAQNMTGAELETAWRAHFGIGPDEEFSYGDRGVPGDYRKAGVQQLLEFKFTHVDRPDSATDAVDSGDDEGVGDTGDEGAPEGVCQVCRTDTEPLTDGLCADCARTAGLRVVPDADSDDARDGKSKAAGD